MEKGFYLYCVLNSTEELDINILGIDNKHEPYIISCQEVGILVSEVMLSEFGQQELAEKVQDLAWLQRKAKRHEQVIEEVMSKTSVIPLTFGVIFKKEIRLKEAISQSLPEIKETFEVINGCEEWGLKLYCDFLQLRDSMSKISPEVKEIESRLEKSQGASMEFLEQRLEQELDNKVKKEAFRIADEIYEELSTIAVQDQLNKIEDLEIDGFSKPMLLNSVYLIGKDRSSDLLIKLKELEVNYSDLGFYFYYSGPWPPYNFSYLEL
ncbi:GvpL/GvpF family gas vesicle protein [Acetohalobium arabaticum]|uniref:Gas vesicle synthesis GvpLGvpF n=1 Tax=Acetohalobium arabaticum (strain ATCC 49924 / DSM 5501 / Z-7288) TaxID=574087 RepID=D9QST9_ACEAZ|nr:GvpL/GvpF family gas vesicle protein [Acetohalobium arabaticum]ADL11627.1 Gas vesicle synthesis GvpLGvpF [Acetohalobium arabaticum DSM 5501]